MSGTPSGRQVIFVDGQCVLCHGLVEFLLKIDKRKVLCFSTLQGETAKRLFAGTSYECEREGLLSVLYVRNCGRPGQQVYTRSTAALLALRDIGGLWWWLSWFTFIPGPLRDWVYRLIARYRYRWFGKHDDHCPLPTDGQKERFLA